MKFRHNKEVSALVDWLKDLKEATLEQISNAGFSKEAFVEAFNSGRIFEPSLNKFRVV